MLSSVTDMPYVVSSLGVATRFEMLYLMKEQFAAAVFFCFFLPVR